jgi:peptidoglycan/xylan/chitin deacetylase (PgdA/CDA1 family)
MILAREHIPSLCYHHVRDWQASDPAVDRPYIVPTAQFAAQMDYLDSHGYHTITPDQLVAYLTTGQTLPDKPVLLSFDDGDEDQWTNALPILQKHHFTATFFIMTVVLDKPFFLLRTQVHALDEMGMTIGAHTWDHHRVTDYTDADWTKQVTGPARELSELVGHPILYFAYPYGLWNTAAVAHIKQAGFVAAFQLEAAPDQDEPLFTIPRVIGSGYWKPDNLEHALLTRF